MRLSLDEEARMYILDTWIGSIISEGILDRCRVRFCHAVTLLLLLGAVQDHVVFHRISI